MSEALLKDRDYTIVVAKTSSDLLQKPPGYEQRWSNAHDAILTLAQKCETFDPDGLTLYLSDRRQSEQFKSYKHVKSSQITEIFEAHYPPATIDLLKVLQTILHEFFIRKAAQQTKPNGEMILILIDGEPSDRMAISRLLIQTANQLDHDTELGIGFIQLGDDLIARGFLAALDDNLKSTGAKFDIVHTQVITDLQSHSLTEFLQDVLSD
ncbi:hypothetical protein ACKFKG_12140 [Phormidesmis sp. 146-35]